MKSLFRDEAINAQRRRVEGEIIVVRPLQLPYFFAFAFAIIIIVVGFLIFGEFTNRVRVVGTLVPELGIRQIFSPIPGVVAEKMFKNGQFVRQGDALYAVRAERYTNHQEAVESLISNFAVVRRQSISIETDNLEIAEASENKKIKATIAELKNQMVVISRQISRQRTHVEIADSARQRYRSLLPKGYVTLDQVQDRKHPANPPFMSSDC